MTHHHPIETAVDVGALSILFGVFFSGLPHVTALLTFVWVLIRLYETNTVQRWLILMRGKCSG